MRTRKFCIWLSVLAMVAVSCNGNSIVPEDEKKTELSLSARETLEVTIGEKAAVYASVNKEGMAGKIVWMLPDDDIASMTPTAVPSGMDAGKTSAVEVTAKAIGKALLVAAVDNVDARCVINVVPRLVESISLDKTEVQLKVGQTDHLTVTITPSDATEQTIRWMSDNESVVSVAGAVVTAHGAGTAVVTAMCGNCSATCTYTVSNIEAESIALDKAALSLTETETELVNLTILPENVTMKDVVWTSSAPGVAAAEFLDADPNDNIVSCVVTAVSEGDAEVTATLGTLTAKFSVHVSKKQEPLADPVVGDYFYSDGTWSTGYPSAPLDGKTVIGIVFQTNPDRINETDMKDGYTHGYVACSQLVYNPVVQEGKEIDRTVMYSISDSFDIMGGSVLPYVWYGNVDGRNESNLVLEYAKRTFGNYFNFPAFDYAMTDFRVGAPSSTSGWFIPSTGQVWDMLANLCGDEVARFLKDESKSEVPVSYYYENTEDLGYDPIVRFNEWLSLVPDSMKEDFYANNSGDDILAKGGAEYPYYDRRICDIMTSTVCMYYEGEVSIATIRIGKLVRKNKFKKVQKEDGYVSLDYDWANYSYVCRPILAF